jgi:hypothetical protein
MRYFYRSYQYHKTYIIHKKINFRLGKNIVYTVTFIDKTILIDFVMNTLVHLEKKVYKEIVKKGRHLIYRFIYCLIQKKTDEYLTE